MKTFTAQIKDFNKKVEKKIEAIVKSAAQEVFEIAQTPVAKGGNMPVDTGFLRNSLVSQLNGSTILGGTDSYALVIESMEMGDVFFAGWTAEYAIYQNYGARGMQGRFYMDLAAQQWQSLVNKWAAVYAD